MTYTTYTVWSRRRLLGETTLGFVRIFPLHRMGWLIPDDAALKVIPQVSTDDASNAAIDYAQLLKKDRSGEKRIDLEDLHQTTEYADLAAAGMHEGAFGLELRRADGSAVPTEWIAIQDTHRLIALGEAAAREFEESGEEIDPEIEEIAVSLVKESESEREDRAWKSLEVSEGEEMQRYQVMVELINEFDVP